MSKNQERFCNPIWHNIFPYGTVSVLIGKKRKRKHVLDLIAILELRGQLTLVECAESVLAHPNSDREGQTVTKWEIRIKRGIYYNEVRRGIKKSSKKRKKSGEKCPRYKPLLSEGYVIMVDKIKNEKNKTIPRYFVTLKGHLLSLGFEFADNDLRKFIQHASTNCLFFAYLNSLITNISLNFVKKIFLTPIKELIKKKRIILDDNYQFNFDLITSSIAFTIHKFISKSWQEINTYNPKTDTSAVYANYDVLKNIDQLMMNTWFDLQDGEKWIKKMIALYYKDKEAQWFYEKNSDPIDATFLYRVMREIHTTYYGSYRQPIPPKHVQKYPLPIKRQRKQTEPEFPKDRERFTARELYYYEHQKNDLLV